MPYVPIVSRRFRSKIEVRIEYLEIAFTVSAASEKFLFLISKNEVNFGTCIDYHCDFT